MSTQTERLIAQKMEEIEKIRNTQYTQDIIDVLQNKKHTEEELYAVCRAFTGFVDKKKRQDNLIKARTERKNKPKVEAPVPAQ